VIAAGAIRTGGIVEPQAKPNGLGCMCASAPWPLGRRGQAVAPARLAAGPQAAARGRPEPGWAADSDFCFATKLIAVYTRTSRANSRFAMHSTALSLLRLAGDRRSITGHRSRQVTRAGAHRAVGLAVKLREHMVGADLAARGATRFWVANSARVHRAWLWWQPHRVEASGQAPRCRVMKTKASSTMLV
jgi:hypothetical protein